jgi:hypothetical protein
VAPTGALVQLPEINYDSLVTNYLGPDNNYGHEQTLKWLAKYALIGNEVQCPECQQQLASLVKRAAATDSYAVNNYIFYLSLLYL